MGHKHHHDDCCCCNTEVAGGWGGFFNLENLITIAIIIGIIIFIIGIF